MVLGTLDMLAIRLPHRSARYRRWIGSQRLEPRLTMEVSIRQNWPPKDRRRDSQVDSAHVARTPALGNASDSIGALAHRTRPGRGEHRQVRKPSTETAMLDLEIISRQPCQCSSIGLQLHGCRSATSVRLCICVIGENRLSALDRKSVV